MANKNNIQWCFAFTFTGSDKESQNHWQLTKIANVAVTDNIKISICCQVIRTG